MTERISTCLGSFESNHWIIDQVQRAHIGHFRFRRYNRLSDVSDKFAHICFSEMAKPIWTHLGSFERQYRAIDQVWRSFVGHFRFRRYNGLSDVSEKFALFRTHIWITMMAEQISTRLGLFESYYWFIYQVQRAHIGHFWFQRYNRLSDLYTDTSLIRKYII